MGPIPSSRPVVIFFLCRPSLCLEKSGPACNFEIVRYAALIILSLFLTDIHIPFDGKRRPTGG